MNNISENILRGAVIAIPTDTVYGLVCDANNKSAIKKIYDIKGRDISKPISIFVKDISSIYKYIDSDIDEHIKNIMQKYWPGALTIIFKKNKNELKYLNEGNDTIGIRIPNNKRILSILNEIDTPLAQTSCNKSGEKPYTTSIEIKSKLKDKIDIIVDGSISQNNIASTVVDFSSGKLVVIRHGDLSENKEFKS